MTKSAENDQPVKKSTWSKWPIGQVFIIFSIEHMIDVPIAHVPSEWEIFEK